jgi:hypothetical protein
MTTRRQFIRTGTHGLGLLAMTSAVSPFLSGTESAPAAGEGSFTFAFLTDTHLDMKCSEANLAAIARWIVANKDPLRICHVGHQGDVGDRRGSGDIHAMLRMSRRALQPVADAGIPLSVAIGNHDYDASSNTRPCEAFNQPDTFGLEFYGGKPWFGGTFESGTARGRAGVDPGGTANHYFVQRVSGHPMLFLTLELFPRDKVLAWASKLVHDRFPDHDVIVTTHAFLDDKTGQRCREVTYPGFSRAPGGEYSNDGDEMWEKHLKFWKNLRLVTSGHFINGPRQAYLQQRGVHGNIAHAHFWNYQNWGIEKGELVRSVRAGPHQASMLKLFKVQLPENRVFMENLLPSVPGEGEPAHPDFYHFRMRA